MKNAYAVGVTILCAILTVALIREKRASHNMESSLAGLRAQAESASSSTGDLHKGSGEISSSLPVTDHPRAPSEPSSVSPSSAQPEVARIQTREAVIDRAATSSPELQELYLRQQTIRFPQRFGLFYASLDLSPEEIAEFERIMAESAQAVIDVSVSAIGQGYAKDDVAAKQIMAEARLERDKGLRTLLGDAGFQEFQRYEQGSGAKSLADTLAQSLYFTDSPMDRSTALQLTRVVAANVETNGGQVSWEQLTKDARSFMTPTQIRALESHAEMIANGAKVHDALVRAGVDMTKPSP